MDNIHPNYQNIPKDRLPEGLSQNLTMAPTKPTEEGSGYTNDEYNVWDTMFSGNGIEAEKQHVIALAKFGNQLDSMHYSGASSDLAAAVLGVCKSIQMKNSPSNNLVQKMDSTLSSFMSVADEMRTLMIKMRKTTPIIERKKRVRSQILPLVPSMTPLLQSTVPPVAPENVETDMEEAPTENEPLVVKSSKDDDLSSPKSQTVRNQLAKFYSSPDFERYDDAKKNSAVRFFLNRLMKISPKEWESNKALKNMLVDLIDKQNMIDGIKLLQAGQSSEKNIREMINHYAGILNQHSRWYGKFKIWIDGSEDASKIVITDQ
ncbi:putative phosphoprotein [Apple rootstock virus A]|uniref:Putative phosphoprotein n=1 Tax=Apple rootstock virus A TaxID=2563012 RepID=A0A4D6DDD4_9RHAB|nr:putative phosphoprotein [Apple rootstock virus A]QBZ28533.1 putative phosphoprotein [Apple rootstock virus A]